MKKAFAVALCAGWIGTTHALPTVTPQLVDPLVRDVLCAGPKVIAVLQTHADPAVRLTATVKSYDAKPIGDRALVCNVQALVIREDLLSRTVQKNELDKIFLVAIGGEPEPIGQQFADALLRSKVIRDLATVH